LSCDFGCPSGATLLPPIETVLSTAPLTLDEHPVDYRRRCFARRLVPKPRCPTLERCACAWKLARGLDVTDPTVGLDDELRPIDVPRGGPAIVRERKLGRKADLQLWRRHDTLCRLHSATCQKRRNRQQDAARVAKHTHLGATSAGAAWTGRACGNDRVVRSNVHHYALGKDSMLPNTNTTPDRPATGNASLYTTVAGGKTI
jgi:hypothetical protein